MRILSGDIISHAQMNLKEGVSLQKGMNFKIKGRNTVILMSVRAGAPYEDRVEEGGKILIYEGHDLPKNLTKNPKSVDQPERTQRGSLTENGKFKLAADKYKEGSCEPELINVYEKIKKGIWVYNGLFELIDSWIELSGGRNVFKFKLRITDKTLEQREIKSIEQDDIDHNRIIPTSVKLEVWKRDKGKCVTCGSKDNLHFDHILPFSKGGTSIDAKNIQLLCARHNLVKRDKII